MNWIMTAWFDRWALRQIHPVLITIGRAKWLLMRHGDDDVGVCVL
jgi:hypothetical protein